MSWLLPILFPVVSGRVDVWIWCLLFAAVLFTLNAISSRVFGESEFWFALIKVSAVVGLIVLGGAALLRFHPLAHDGYPAWERTS